MNVNMTEAKKKLKKKTKIRESHRTFDRRIISEAKESLDGGESVDFKKLKAQSSKLFRTRFWSSKAWIKRFFNI